MKIHSMTTVGLLLASALIPLPSSVDAQTTERCYRDMCLGDSYSRGSAFFFDVPELARYSSQAASNDQCYHIAIDMLNVPLEDATSDFPVFVKIFYVADTGEILQLQHSNKLNYATQRNDTHDWLDLVRNRYGEPTEYIEAPNPLGEEELENAVVEHSSVFGDGLPFVYEEDGYRMTLSFMYEVFSASQRRRENNYRFSHTLFSYSNTDRISEVHELQRSCGIFD